MTAITIVPGRCAPVPAGPVHIPRPATRRGPRVSRAVYRRRRLLAAAVLVSVVIVMGEAGVALGGHPLASPERRPNPPALVAGETVVVRPGDTLWSIASRVDPAGDPRPLVDALASVHGDAPLEPGDVIRIPGTP